MIDECDTTNFGGNDINWESFLKTGKIAETSLRCFEIPTLNRSFFWPLRNVKRFNIPFRFRKAGRVWCSGARETHWATCDMSQ